MSSTANLPLIAICTAFISVLAGCNSDCISGSGNQTTQTRTVDAFDEIEVSGSVFLLLKQDSTQNVVVVADDNIQEHVKTSVSGSKLNIKVDGDFCDGGLIQVFVNAKQFNALKASGAVEVESKGRINTGDFELELSGASKISLDLSAAKVTTSSEGASEINLKGQAGEHEIELSGASKVNAFDFVVGNYAINSSGASKCYINVLNSLRVKSSGASEVEYRGNPSDVSNKDSGASSIRKVN